MFSPAIRRRIPLMLVAALTLMLGACGTARKSTARATGGDRKPATDTRRPPKRIDVDPSAPQAVQSLLNEANSWLGVPYAWGGNDRNGVDCSGFVSQVFLNACSIKLPRTSATQSEYCTGVERTKLEPGDLVFFDTTSKREGRVSHVGLYIGHGNMIHASSSKGVIVSSIEGNYFAERLLKGGRIEAFRAMEQAEQQTLASEPVKVRKAEKPAKRKGRAPRAKAPTEPKPEPSAEPQPQPAPAVAPVPAPLPSPKARPAVSPEISSADARALVLDNLVEEKIDSIYAR